MIKYFYIVFATGAVVAALWIIGTFTHAYLTETGTTWQRLLKAAQDSATILWSKFAIAVSMGVGGVVSIADTLGEPQIGAAVQKYLTPQIASGILVAAMVVSVMARKRTLGK